MTLDEANKILDDLNDRAHDKNFETWEFAGDDEELREEASSIQQMDFDTFFSELLPYEQINILKLCLINEDLKEQYMTYSGWC